MTTIFPPSWTYLASAAGITIAQAADDEAQRTALGLGTAAVINVGTGANQIVQLDGLAKLPAVDGSQLTGISAGIGGSTGANDNRVPRSDGTGGGTLQTSAWAIADSGDLSQSLTWAGGQELISAAIVGSGVATGNFINLNGSGSWGGNNPSHFRVTAAGRIEVGGIWGEGSIRLGQPVQGGLIECIYGTGIRLTMSNQIVGVIGGLNGKTYLNSSLRPNVYTFATVPTPAANEGYTISISDRSYRWATSDGTSWNWTGTTTAIS